MKQAGIMLIIKDGLILGMSRRYDSNKFSIIGGKSEENETPEQTAIRECFEETNIVVSKCQLIYHRVELKDSFDGEDYHTYCFFATEWSGTPSDSEEGHVEWITAEHLTGPQGAFADYNKKTLNVFSTMFPHIVIK